MVALLQLQKGRVLKSGKFLLAHLFATYLIVDQLAQMATELGVQLICWLKQKITQMSNHL